MAGWMPLVGCSVRCLTVKTSAPLHPRRAHPAELLPRRRQARPSTLGVLPHREGDAVDPLTSSPNSLSPFLAGSRGPWAGGGAGGGRPGLAGAGRSCARRDVHSALERCISPSRCAVRSARSSTKCTSRRPGAVWVGPGTGDRRSRRPCRGPRPSVCPNLLQRPGSRRSAGGGSSIFCAFIRDRSRACPGRCGRL